MSSYHASFDDTRIKTVCVQYLGKLPGITDVGMAALLPGAEKGLGIDKKPTGIVVTVDGHSVASRQVRMSLLQEHAGVPSVVYRLGEVVKITPKRKKEIDAARLVVVTSQEIDRLGEEAVDDEDARIYMNGVLEKLRQAIRSLAKIGVRQFVIVADHGFHLLEGIEPGFAMDAPGGDTVEVHSRVWIGLGGATADGYQRFKASDLELGGSLEFAFPCGLGLFKVKGGTGAYFHGGLSLQEHVLPLLTIKAPLRGPATSSSLKIKISIAKAKITNRLFTVTLEAESNALFPNAEKRVRLEVFSEKTEVGAAVTAGYDFEDSTREVRVILGKPNVVTIMLQATVTPKSITVQVVDCESQLVLAALKDIPVELAI